MNNADQYWELLKDGRSGIIRVPPERWDADAYYTDDHTVPGTICNREGGFLTSWQPDEFDAEFFAISPREAAAIDPQQRLLLEVACEALEDAGIPSRDIRGTQTGVFIGQTAYDYMLNLSAGLAQEDLDAYVLTGNSANFAAGRLSYFLGARGPAVVVDTACSSSLTAIHLACQSLRGRETDTAVVGGTNLMLSPGCQHRLLPVGDVVAGRPVQDLRRGRRRLRPQRGLRRRGAQTARPTPSATATGCWPWCAVRRSTRTAPAVA